MRPVLRITISLILGIAWSYSFAQSDTLSRSDCKKDLDTLKVWVERVHPLHLSRVNDSIWDSALNHAHSNLSDSISVWDFTKSIGEVLGTLRDSHTLVSLSSWQNNIYKKHGKSKLSLKYIDDNFYVKDDPLGIVNRGVQITKINDVSVSELLEIAMKISPSEGDSYISKLRVSELLLDEIAI